MLVGDRETISAAVNKLLLSNDPVAMITGSQLFEAYFTQIDLSVEGKEVFSTIQKYAFFPLALFLFFYFEVSIHYLGPNHTSSSKLKPLTWFHVLILKIWAPPFHLLLPFRMFFSFSLFILLSLLLCVY